MAEECGARVNNEVKGLAAYCEQRLLQEMRAAGLVGGGVVARHDRPVGGASRRRRAVRARRARHHQGGGKVEETVMIRTVR